MPTQECFLKQLVPFLNNLNASKNNLGRGLNFFILLGSIKRGKIYYIMGLFDDNNSNTELLKKETITVELRNSLWTFYYSKILASSRERYIADINDYLKKLWSKHFKERIDSIPSYRSSLGDIKIDTESTIATIRNYFIAIDDWKILYPIFEFTFSFIVPPCKEMYRNDLNRILTEERSPLRFVENNFVEITNQIELVEIQTATSSTKDIFTPVYTHLNASIEYLSDASNNGYRNSIKESISAVEALCKILTNDEKATLGEALKKIQIHKALEKSLLALYGYTSDSGGIRHSLGFGDDAVEYSDAKFMLVSCCAFINYLKSKKL